MSLAVLAQRVRERRPSPGQTRASTDTSVRRETSPGQIAGSCPAVIATAGAQDGQASAVGGARFSGT
jgi:hypothetical protein